MPDGDFGNGPPRRRRRERAVRDRRPRARRVSAKRRRTPGAQRRPAAAVFALSVALLCVCVLKLGGYTLDFMRSKRRSAQAQAAYAAAAMEEGGDREAGAPVSGDASVTPEPQAQAGRALLPSVGAASARTPLPANSSQTYMSALHERAQTALRLAQDEARATPEPTQAVPVQATPDPEQPLPKRDYPLNPYLHVAGSFDKLRRQNRDIVGYLSLGELLGEAVVQRDNAYYLRRDYLGYHNVNGAIFLEASCDLEHRPYTLTLYGHNMKTGAMFGCLRNYENLSFYHKNPFISFDTVYEEGRYVIFSVATVSLDPKSERFAEFYALETCPLRKREQIIERLCDLSCHTCAVDVQAGDQLLLLVTCVDDDSERRVVAARRVRDTETEAELLSWVGYARGR